MKPRAFLFTIFFLSIAAPAQAQSLGIDTTIAQSFSVHRGATDGFSFSLAQSYTVTALGVWDDLSDGLGEAHPVGLWTSGGTLLASATVPSGTAGTLVPSAVGTNGWRFTPIADLLLTPGDYVIGAFYSSTNTDLAYATIPAGNVILLPGETFGHARAQSAGSLTFPDLEFPVADAGHFGPNFLAVAVPEPTTWALMILGVGAAASGVWYYRRKRAKLLDQPVEAS